MYMRTDTPYKTIEDVRTASTPPKCGATGVTSAAFYMPKLLDDAIGTKFDVVSGYIAGSDIDLAVERGEVMCRAFTFNAFFAANRLSLGARKISPVCCIRPETNGTQGLKDVPIFNELMDKYKTSGRVRDAWQSGAGLRRVRSPIVLPSGRSR